MLFCWIPRFNSACKLRSSWALAWYLIHSKNLVASEGCEEDCCSVMMSSLGVRTSARLTMVLKRVTICIILLPFSRLMIWSCFFLFSADTWLLHDKLLPIELSDEKVFDSENKISLQHMVKLMQDDYSQVLRERYALDASSEWSSSAVHALVCSFKVCTMCNFAFDSEFREEQLREYHELKSRMEDDVHDLRSKLDVFKGRSDSVMSRLGSPGVSSHVHLTLPTPKSYSACLL